jgi:hypothetical protein
MSGQGVVVACGWVAGKPAGKPAPRGGAHGRRASVWATASRPVKLWRAAVEKSLGSAVRNLGGCRALLEALGGGFGLAPVAVGLELEFVFATVDRAKWGGLFLGKPDADNLVKLWQDLAGTAGLFGGQDDARVARVSARKIWGEASGCRWEVSQANPDAPNTCAAVNGLEARPDWLG